MIAHIFGQEFEHFAFLLIFLLGGVVLSLSIKMLHLSGYESYIHSSLTSEEVRKCTLISY